MKQELAAYILELNRAARATSGAGDRSLYEKYLAGAAVILALVERGAEKEVIQNEVQTHDRLLGNTWVVDDSYQGPGAAWQMVKEKL